MEINEAKVHLKLCSSRVIARGVLPEKLGGGGIYDLKNI